MNFLSRIIKALSRMGIDEKQVTLGHNLRGKFVTVKGESLVSRGHLVTATNSRGMIRVRDYCGWIDPYQVVRVDRPHSAAEGNC